MSIQLKLGQDLEFDRQSLMQVQLRTGVDPMYGVLQTDSLQAVVRSNAPAESHALQEQKVQLYRDGQLLSTQCLKQCTRAGGEEFTLQCRSNLEFLEGEYMGGMYDRADPLLLVDWILGGRSFSLDDTIANRTVSGYLPICTRSQALRQVAFALGAVVSVDKYGSFRLSALAAEEGITIGPERVLTGARLHTKPAYTKVELVAHSYVPATEWVELYHLKEFGSDPVTLTFTQPNAEYELYDGDMIESGPNFITFQPSNFTGLKVKPYIHTTAFHTIEEPATESGFSNVLSVRDMTLVNPDNVQQLLQWMHERGQMRQELVVQAIIDQERTGQLVTVTTPWGTPFTGYISQMNSTLTDRSHVAQVTIQGREQEVTG